MRPSDVHNPRRKPKGVRAQGPGRYQLVATSTRDAKDRADARAFAEKVRERERAELEAAAAVLAGGDP